MIYDFFASQAVGTAMAMRPRSSPARTATKVREFATETTESSFVLPSLDKISVPTVALVQRDANRLTTPAPGHSGKRRASSADGSKKRPVGSTPEELSVLKDKVQFERQFMSNKLRSGSAGQPEEYARGADTTGSGIAQRRQQRQQQTAVELQRQNAKLKTKAEKLEAGKAMFEDTQEHIEAAVSGERLRRKNLEGNVKAWEKERRDMLREARERRRQIEAMESRLQESDADLAEQVNSVSELEGELGVAMRQIVGLHYNTKTSG